MVNDHSRYHVKNHVLSVSEKKCKKFNHMSYFDEIILCQMKNKLANSSEFFSKFFCSYSVLLCFVNTDLYLEKSESFTVIISEFENF